MKTVNEAADALVGQAHFSWVMANPLLQFLPERLDSVGCGAHLRNDPSIAWGGPAPETLREELANEVKLAYAPTANATATVIALQNMLYTGLKHRDPRIPSNQRRLYQTGSLLGQELSKLPWLPTYAAGATVRGITGCGKSLCIERFLFSRFKQVYIHEEREDCGWLGLAQLVYLIVPMPADGSRGGLLQEIAMQMDAVLGTDYAAQLRSRFKTVEKGLVAVLHWLALHRCGILVIEEAQERHSTITVFGSDFVTFFLRIMNFGVPLVLVGNPLAFQNIDQFSQDVRRFSEGGRFVFDPVSDYRSLTWKKDLVPVIWGFNVFSEPDEPIVDLSFKLWFLTGGIPDALCRLRRVTLQIAVTLGSNRVTQKHIQLAYDSPIYAPMRPLVEAFATKKPDLLRNFKDIPLQYFQEKWDAERKAEAKRLLRSKTPLDAKDPPTRTLSEHTAEDPAYPAAAESSPTSLNQDEYPNEPRSGATSADPADRRGAHFLAALHSKRDMLEAQADGTRISPQ